MEWIKDYDKELAEYMYHDLIHSNYRGEITMDLPDNYYVDSILCDYDEDCSRESYDKIISLFEKIVNDPEIKMYEDHIQLSERHTLLRLDNDIDIDQCEWWFLVDNSLTDLEEETGVEFSYSGRMNRHILVKNTVENFINAIGLSEKLKDYEDTLIDYVNDNYKGEEEE